MKKLGMLGIIGGAALLTAAPLSLQWSQKNVALSLDSAEAQSGPRAIGPPPLLARRPPAATYLTEQATPHLAATTAAATPKLTSVYKQQLRLHLTATATPHRTVITDFLLEGARHTCDRRHRRGC
jgi:hypothetical protein